MEMGRKEIGGEKVKRKKEIERDTSVEKEKRWTEKVIVREVKMKTGIETGTSMEDEKETGTTIETRTETGTSMEDWTKTGTGMEDGKETGTETGIMTERGRVDHHYHRHHHCLTKTGVSVLCLWDH